MEPWYNMCSVSLTSICIHLFTNRHSLISVTDATINCNGLSFCTVINLYSAGCSWDIRYADIFVFPCKQKLWHSAQNRTKSLHFILSVMVPFPAILFFPWCKTFRGSGSLYYRGFTITLRNKTLSMTSLEICLSIAWRNDNIAEK